MNRPLRRVAFVVASLGAVVGGAIHVRARKEAESSWRDRPPDGVAAHGSMTLQQRSTLETRKTREESRLPAAVEEMEPLPTSLQGTEVDGWLGVDDEGHLVVTPGARWLFDYFLTAGGEESAEQIRARIFAEIERRLPAAGAHEARDLLDRYLAYRDRVRALEASGAPADVRQCLAQLHDIRRELFGDADAAALFGEEEQLQAVDIQRRQVLGDETLDPESRQRRVADLEQQLPAAARQARSEAVTLVRLRKDEQHLRDAGASPEDLHALREQRFGAEAADRLAALDRERAEWQQRLDDYCSGREAIDNNPGLTSEARARAVETLLADRFTPEERRRVEALDTIRTASHWTGRPGVCP